MLEINKIHLGDSYELIKQIPDKSVDCIYTDVPYLIEKGGKGSSPLSKRILKTNYEDLKDIRDGFDHDILDQFVRVSKKINIFIWCRTIIGYDELLQ